MTSRAQGKILVIRGGAIGDFVLTLPVFAALRQHFPHTHLEVVGYAHIAQLAAAAGLVDGLRSIDARPLASFFARDGTLDPALSRYFADFGVVISYLYDPDAVFQNNLARCSKAQFIGGLHRPDEKLTLHASEVFLQALERLAIFEADPVPRLRIPSVSPPQPSAGDEPNRSETRLALHPGSGSEKKNWPEPRWAELIAQLAIRTKWKVLLLGGEGEVGRLDRLASLLPPARVTVARSRPLVDLAKELQKCHFFLGHDSGPSHLAAALGLRGLLLWGETNPAVWRPRGGHVDLLQAGRDLPTLEVKPVLESLLRLVPQF